MKSLFFAPMTHLWIYWPDVGQVVPIFAKPARSLAAHGQPALVGEFSGKALAAAGTCPEDLPFKIPQSGTS